MKILEVYESPFHELQYRTSGRGGVERTINLPFYMVKVAKMPDGISTMVLTSDLQGREMDSNTNRLVGEAVSDELTLLQELGEIPQIDLVVLAGDFFDYPDCHKLGGTGDVTEVWNAFARISDSVCAVLGNHDTVDEQKLDNNIVYLDSEISNVKGIRIGGVSGIIGEPNRNQRKTEAKFKKALQHITSRKSDIILLHQGPDKIKNQQSQSFIRKHLEDNGSSLVIFGHRHWKKPFNQIGNNQILNVDKRLYLVTE